MTSVRDNWKANTRPSAPTEAINRPPNPPLEVKCRVAMRQLNYFSNRVEHILSVRGKYGRLLDDLLDSVARKLGCERKDLRLDHNPALVLREYDPKTKTFTPDANDSYFLIYRTKTEHHVKTNIRGDGALRSDTSERMHRRRLDENRGLRPRKPKKKIQSRGFTITLDPIRKETFALCFPVPSANILRANRKWWNSRAWPKRKMDSRAWQ